MQEIKFDMHLDERRELSDFVFNLNTKSLKIIKSFKSSDLGNHFHRKKTEIFFLVNGEIKSLNVGGFDFGTKYAPFAWRVDPGEFHSIIPEPGAIIVCLSDQTYDPADEVIK
jgi:hypothetical protein